MNAWIVQLTQGPFTYYLAKGKNWGTGTQTATIFSYAKAFASACKQRVRFNSIIDPKAPPPAGLVTIKILEVDQAYNIISERIIP